MGTTAARRCTRALRSRCVTIRGRGSNGAPTSSGTASGPASMNKPRDEISILGRRILTPVMVLVVVYLVGVVGYKVIGGRGHSWLDALYMTTITLTTTGYREVIDITCLLYTSPSPRD